MRFGTLALTLLLGVIGAGFRAHAEEASPEVKSPPGLKALSVLYAGDPESPRTDRFRAFLAPWVKRVETISLPDLDADSAAGFDVVVADWHRRYGDAGYERGAAHAKTLAKEFETPVVMIGAVAGEVVRPWSKLNWL